jgi:hypothetical protein
MSRKIKYDVVPVSEINGEPVSVSAASAAKIHGGSLMVPPVEINQPVGVLPGDMPVDPQDQAASEQDDVRLVVVLFKKGYNKARNEEQIKATFNTIDDDGDLFVQVVADKDAEFQPGDGEMWIVEVNKKPIAKWNHRNPKDGSVTPSILVSGIPLKKIEVPELIQFNDRSPWNTPCYKVRQSLKDGTRVAFVPDRFGEQPEFGETWKVKSSRVLQHDLGPEETVVIAVECLTKMVVRPASAAAQLFAGGETWTPPATKKLGKLLEPKG